MELDVLLLAAGFGTRLRPLTEQIPKALLPIGGVPLLERHLSPLLDRSVGPARGTQAPGPGGSPAPAGADARGTEPITIRTIVVNGHHLADQLRAYLATHPHGDRICFSYEREILGTGGAIAQAAGRLRSDPIAVVNCDALYAPPLSAACRFHLQRTAQATMILSRAPRWASVLARDDRVTAILRGQRHPNGWTFTGCHLLSQELVADLPRGRFHDIIDTYSALIPAGTLAAFDDGAGPDAFLDVGTPADYLSAHHRILGARFGREGAVDPRAEIGDGARIVSSVVFAGSRVAPHARLAGCIVGPGAQAGGDLRDQMVTSLGARAIERPAEETSPDGREGAPERGDSA